MDWNHQPTQLAGQTRLLLQPMQLVTTQEPSAKSENTLSQILRPRPHHCPTSIVGVFAQIVRLGWLGC
jgi:hypothetical protein